MNIVRLVSHFPSLHEISYGLGPTFYYLSREQVRLGLHVHIICKGYPLQKRLEEVEGIRIHRVIAPYNLLMLYELFKLNYRIGVDLIHAHATSGLSHAILKGFHLDRRTRVSYVAHVHGTTKGIRLAWSRIDPSALNKVKIRHPVKRYIPVVRETIMWKSADALIAVSKFLKEELVNLYGVQKERIHVVHNGVDLKTFYPKKSRLEILKALGLDATSRLILYLGGLRPVKGPLYIGKALEKIHYRFPSIKVLFVGERYSLDRYRDKVARKLVKDLIEKGVICMIKNIPHVQLPEYYSAADAVVLPSIYDSFPKVILEAMACGTPVIASAVGGIPELISHGETGILVEPANPDELAEAIISMVSDPKLRKKLGSKARKLVEERFTWKHTAKHTLTVYKKVVGLD